MPPQRRVASLRLILLSVLWFALIFQWAYPAFCAELHDGLAAFHKGDYATSYKDLKPLAEQGNAAAQFFLGVMYNEGLGVPQDYVEAAKWYRKVADQGFAEGQTELGILYDTGHGVRRDYAEAVRLFRKAANQRDASAQWLLGAMYFEGYGVPQDDVQALMWFDVAAAQGNSHGQKLRDKLTKEMTPFQIAEAGRRAKEWKPSTASDHASLASVGGRENGSTAALQSANEGGPASQQSAPAPTQIPPEGRTDGSNARSSVKSPPLKQKFRDRPQVLVSLDDALGSYVRGHYADAYKAFKFLAKHGNASAEYNLGFMYEHGKGVPKDVVKAVEWYRKAAEGGDIDAQLFLGGMYKFGPLPDYALAAAWYRKAAQQGDAIAEYNLGTMCYYGQGVPQDYVQAYMWLNLSAATGNSNAQKELDDMAKHMTQTQITEARRLTREWKPKVLLSARTGASQHQINIASPNKWLVILGSDRLDDRAKSEERLARIKPYAPTARIVNSGTYSRLLAGWWVVVEGPFDKATAEKEKIRLLPVVPDAFVKAAW